MPITNLIETDSIRKVSRIGAVTSTLNGVEVFDVSIIEFEAHRREAREGLLTEHLKPYTEPTYWHLTFQHSTFFSCSRIDSACVRGSEAAGGAGVPAVASAINVFSGGWSAESCRTLATFAHQFHCNDLRAGTPAQMTRFRKMNSVLKYPDRVDLDSVTAQVPEFLPDGSQYRYGSQWLLRVVTDEQLAKIVALPW